MCVQIKWDVAFSVYSINFVIRKHVCSKKAEAAFFSLFGSFCNSETCLFKASGRLLL